MSAALPSGGADGRLPGRVSINTVLFAGAVGDNASGEINFCSGLDGAFDRTGGPGHGGGHLGALSEVLAHGIGACSPLAEAMLLPALREALNLLSSGPSALAATIAVRRRQEAGDSDRRASG